MSKESVVNEIHRSARKNYPRRHVVLKDIDDLWQADLIDMQTYKNENLQNKYILTIIDTFSKYAWGFPLRSKNKQVVTDVFKSLLEKGRVPKNLQTDLGTEFYNSDFQQLMQKYNINHYSTYSTKKASIVERLIRTLKNNLYKLFSLQGNYKWCDSALENIVRKYNSTYHRTIGAMPNDVNHENKDFFLKRYRTMYSTKHNEKYRKFRVGDFVRISKYKGVFAKGYTPNWSAEIFKIDKVQNTNPATYLLKDTKQRPILGAFYAQEIQKTMHPNIYLIEKILKRKGNKLFVQWLGLSAEENSWIKKTNLL